jgi:hypothetical protein
MFLHAREGHVEPLGKRRDRSVRTPELLQNTAPGGVRECSERDIEVGLDPLNHMVQCTRWSDGMQWEAGAPAALSAVHLTHDQRHSVAETGTACDGVPIPRLPPLNGSSNLADYQGLPCCLDDGLCDRVHAVDFENTFHLGEKPVQQPKVATGDSDDGRYRVVSPRLRWQPDARRHPLLTQQLANLCRTQGTEFMHEADARVKLREPRQALLKARHADKDQPNLALLDKSFRLSERFRLRFGAEFNNVFNHPLRPPSGDQSVELLGTFDLAVNPTTRQIQIDSLDRNLDFGRFFNSYNQEGIDNRRTIRLTLRLTF